MASLEGGIPPCPPQAPVPTPGFGRRQNPWRCPRSDPVCRPTIDCIGEAFENLALAALNETTILQQLTAANLALTASVTLLTAANKKLTDALARNKGSVTPAATPATGKSCSSNKPFLGNYCWTHGHKVNQNNMSATCRHKTAGHKDNATSTNTMGCSKADKGWNSCT
jgi:hypothetical protein